MTHFLIRLNNPPNKNRIIVVNLSQSSQYPNNPKKAANQNSCRSYRKTTGRNDESILKMRILNQQQKIPCKKSASPQPSVETLWIDFQQLDRQMAFHQPTLGCKCDTIRYATITHGSSPQVKVFEPIFLMALRQNLRSLPAWTIDNNNNNNNNTRAQPRPRQHAGGAG